MAKDTGLGGWRSAGGIKCAPCRDREVRPPRLAEGHQELFRENQVGRPWVIAIRQGAGRAMRTLLGATSLLLAFARRAVAGARSLWRRLPVSVRERVVLASSWTGLPHVLSYIATYDEIHDPGNFAGNLVVVHRQYSRSSADEKEKLARQFDNIMEQLVMPNGVHKTTYPLRQHNILAKVLADQRCRPQKSGITVLDVPASSGVAALDSIAMLTQYYTISAYVLGDLCFHVYYDTGRECVFDDAFNLLQVKHEGRFFSVYRGHRSGDLYTPLTGVLLLPLDIVAWYLKKKYVYSPNSDTVPLLLIHPDVAARLRGGDFSLSKVDVFSGIGGHYDLILSFNFLQRNYFPREQIARGVENLTNALNEQGFLIMGNDLCYSVGQKREGKLVVIEQDGRF
jgi:hypothetical protein